MKLPRAHHLPTEVLAGQLLCLHQVELPFNSLGPAADTVLQSVADGRIAGIKFTGASAPVANYYCGRLIKQGKLPPFLSAEMSFEDHSPIQEMTRFTGLAEFAASDLEEFLPEITGISGVEARAIGLNMLINKSPALQSQIQLITDMEAALLQFGITLACQVQDKMESAICPSGINLIEWVDNDMKVLHESMTEGRYLWLVDPQQHQPAIQKLCDEFRDNASFLRWAIRQVDTSLSLRKELFRRKPAQRHPGRLHKWLSHPEHLKTASRLAQQASRSSKK